MVGRVGRMVAAQLLVMNHFLMGLTHNSPSANNAFADINSVVADGCGYGCTRCSPINGCLACKPPFFLLLHREGIRQTASCTRVCPKGFYKLKKKRNGFCSKCIMRGCVDCVGPHYCSGCDSSFVNFFGKCIRPRSGHEGLVELGLYTTVLPNNLTTTGVPQIPEAAVGSHYNKIQGNNTPEVSVLPAASQAPSAGVTTPSAGTVTTVLPSYEPDIRKNIDDLQLNPGRSKSASSRSRVANGKVAASFPKATDTLTNPLPDNEILSVPIKRRRYQNGKLCRRRGGHGRRRGGEGERGEGGGGGGGEGGGKRRKGRRKNRKGYKQRRRGCRRRGRKGKRKSRGSVKTNEHQKRVREENEEEATNEHKHNNGSLPAIQFGKDHHETKRNTTNKLKNNDYPEMIELTLLKEDDDEQEVSQSRRALMPSEKRAFNYRNRPRDMVAMKIYLASQRKKRLPYGKHVKQNWSRVKSGHSRSRVLPLVRTNSQRLCSFTEDLCGRSLQRRRRLRKLRRRRRKGSQTAISDSSDMSESFK